MRPKFAKQCDENTYIKVPVTPEGLAAIKVLKAEGYKLLQQQSILFSRTVSY